MDHVTLVELLASSDSEYSQSNVARKKKKVKFTPVQIARLQALYSASIRGVVSHPLQKPQKIPV